MRQSNDIYDACSVISKLNYSKLLTVEKKYPSTFVLYFVVQFHATFADLCYLKAQALVGIHTKQHIATATFIDDQLTKFSFLLVYEELHIHTYVHMYLAWTHLSAIRAL